MFVKVFTVSFLIHFGLVRTVEYWEPPYDLKTTTETPLNSEICKEKPYMVTTPDLEILSANWPHFSFERVECEVHINGKTFLI